MSAAPIDPNDVSSGIKDGLLASVLGGMAMVARLLLSHEPVTFPWVVRRVAAASIFAVIVGYGIEDQIHSAGLRMAVIGASGYCAPEGLDYLLKWVRAKGEAEIKKVTGVSIKRDKNAKRKKAK
jgi:hypothetical protein